MQRTTVVLPLAITLAGIACGSGLDPARDVTGTWLGNAPNGAFYADNVANPNCEYEADLRIVLVQDGRDLTGSFMLTVRKATKLLATGLPCVAVGTSNSEALFGSVSASSVEWELFTSRIPFTGSFTSDILTATFASTQAGGIAGNITVRRQ